MSAHKYIPGALHPSMKAPPLPDLPETASGSQNAAHTPGRVAIESLCEHALLARIPDNTRLTAHWLIANSAKIAAAPALLEVAVSVAALEMSDARHDPAVSWVIGMAVAAIAKARGGK